MRLLLDTHAFLWWLGGDALLPSSARAAIADAENAVFVSAASVWEITTKHRLGKLSSIGALVADFDNAISEQGFASLPVTVRHGQLAGALPGPHCDPFDRMLVAQALLENLVLISNERPFDAYGVGRLW